MQRISAPLGAGLLLLMALGKSGWAQTALTWQEIRSRFEAANPTLQAGLIGIDESRAQEITAHLRPNPNLSVIADQIDPFPAGPDHGAFAYFLPEASVNYLHERRHKRELRLESAKEGTQIAESDQADLTRTMVFTLRMAFVQTLQEKAILALARENLAYYDHVLDVNRDRYKAGAIARVDLARLQLQRVQYESDLQTADVNLRTAKIQLLSLLNDRTPIDQFDVSGAFDFSEQTPAQDELRRTALAERPDLRAAIESVDKAQTDYKLAVANGSTDPTFGMDFARNPPIPVYVGVNVNIPLRIFDRNQGEKERTRLDISRNERLRDAAEALVFSDVDSAYVTLLNTVILLRPYKTKYLETAARVRDTIAFSYQRGQASLVE